MNQPIYASGDVVVTEPRRRRHRLLSTLLGVVLLTVIVVAALVLLLKGTSSKSAMNDVTVTTCRAVATGKPTATGQILNHSSKTSTYVVRLKFTDPQGNTLSEGIAPVKSVGARQTAEWDLTGDRDVNGAVQCKITGVSRTHVPGQ